MNTRWLAIFAAALGLTALLLCSSSVRPAQGPASPHPQGAQRNVSLVRMLPFSQPDSSR